MADVLYTTTDSIRAAIGVSDAEIQDKQILDLNVEDQLVLYLEQVYPDYEALADANAPGKSPTKKQASDWKKLKLLCQYAGAVLLMLAGQNILVHSLTDGGTTMARFGRNDLDTTLARLERRRDELLAALLEDDLSGASFRLLARASPSYDPVTGE